MAQESTLFKPLKIGKITTAHRIAMAPLTRYRAEDDHVPGPLAREYYSQRASVPGTLIFTEATQISLRAGGLGNAPGIWNSAQISAWKNIVEAVHKKGCFIIAQLYAGGRIADPDLAAREGFDVVGPSAISIGDATHAVPRATTEDEIRTFIADFTQAATNAMGAGFDGVEIHGAYGTLVDQFIQDTANQRTDEWGGSIENRSRFPLEVVKAVAKEIGKEHVGIRFSPWGTYLSMRMKDPIAQFDHLVRELSQLGIQHLHLVEPRVDGIFDVQTLDSNDVLVHTWTGNSDAPLVLTGGFTSDDARRATDEKYEGKDVLIAFGRYFTSNPDLVYRIREGVALTKYNRETFYKVKSPDGYTDWPFSAEFQSKQELVV
jgi:NADPH2 dehydrogenase